MRKRKAQAGLTLFEMALLFGFVVLVVVGGILISLGCWGGSACTKRAVTGADLAIGCSVGEVCTNPGTVCYTKWIGNDCICETVISDTGACRVACKR